MYQTLDLMDDNSERVQYDSPDMPVYARRGMLSHFQNLAASSHWHDDVEFIVTLCGRMSYNINGDILTIKEGDGLFVNSKHLHYGFSADGSDCDFLCVLFSPILLCANQFLENNCVVPVITNNSFPYRILHRDVPWESELIGSIGRVYELHNEHRKATDLHVQSELYHIWALLYDHMPDCEQLSTKTGNRLSVLRDMVGFVQKHYEGKISLADISLAGNVCMGSCCAIFNEYLHQTPVQYLTSYRLNKSMELLADPAVTITEVALSVGFGGASYYAEIFRKHFDCSPTEYRKKMD